MDADLSTLEQRVHQLVELCIQLRKANSELRQHLASSRGDNKRLEDRVSQARVRLEALLDQLPESAE